MRSKQRTLTKTCAHKKSAHSQKRALIKTYAFQSLRSQMRALPKACAHIRLANARKSVRSRIFPPKIVKLTNKVIHTPSNWHSQFPNSERYKWNNKSGHDGKNGSRRKGSDWIPSIQTEGKWRQKSRKFFSLVGGNILILLIILSLQERLAEKRTKLNSSLKIGIFEVETSRCLMEFSTMKMFAQNVSGKKKFTHILHVLKI